jgi:hypothetical protein
MKILPLIPLILLFFSCKEKNDDEMECYKKAFEISRMENSTFIGDKYQIYNQSVKLSFVYTKNDGYKFIFSKYSKGEEYPFNDKGDMIFTSKIRKETWDKVDSIFRDINFWCLDSIYQGMGFSRNQDLYFLSSEYLGDIKNVNITVDSSASMKSKTYKLWSFMKLMNVRKPKIIEEIEEDGSVFKVISQNEIATFKVLVDGVEAKKIEECKAVFKINKKATLTCYETYSNDDTFIYKKEIEPYIQNQ